MSCNIFFKSTISLVLLVLLSVSLSAQNNNKDYYQSLIRQARAMGYSDQQIMSQAKSQGYSAAQLKMLTDELETKDYLQEELNERTREQPATIAPSELNVSSPPAIPIFGIGYFRSGGANAESNLNLPTPKEYILGPGDELYVDIYGASEKYYTTMISPDGFVTLSNIGPIAVAGLTIEEATKRIRTRLVSLYSGLSGSNPTTFLQVGLGKIRSIQVNVVGEVNNPGTYSISSLATVVNLLHAANGISENGSLRKVQLYRSNKLVAELDLYQFLLKGQLSANIRLENGDVVLVPAHLNRVTIVGEVKRPAIFEMKDGENLTHLMEYAGGFTAEAFTKSISLQRITQSEKSVADVFLDQFPVFTVQAGDLYDVGRVLDRFTNRVSIRGAVMRPGSFAYTDGLTLNDLIAKAQGLRQDALPYKVLILRTGDNLTSEALTINLEAGEGAVVLKREDKIEVLSIFDSREEPFVRISGEVIKTGIYPFAANMTLGHLIFLANGLRESARGATIEIARRLPNQSPTNQTELLFAKLDGDLKIEDGKETFVLLPYDEVMIRRNPNFFEAGSVSVSGELMLPGNYVLTSRNERVSDIIKRAGGLTDWAFGGGAVLIRKTEYYRDENEKEQRIDNLQKVSGALEPDRSEADLLMSRKIEEELDAYVTQLSTTNESLASKARRDRLEAIKSRHPLLGDLQAQRSESIPLDLDDILKKPGGKSDIILEPGDIIVVPRASQTVRLRGQVLYPTTVQFEKPRSARYYVYQAGGFDARALRRKSYVIYANGEVARTRNLLIVNDFPRVEAGSEVIVPVKPPKIPVRPGELASLTTGLAALVAVVVQVVNSNR